MPNASDIRIGSLLHLMARVPLEDARVTSVCVAVLETLQALHLEGRYELSELARTLDADQKTALELLPPDAVNDPRRQLIRSLAPLPKSQV